MPGKNRLIESYEPRQELSTHHHYSGALFFLVWISFRQHMNNSTYLPHLQAADAGAEADDIRLPSSQLAQLQDL